MEKCVYDLKVLWYSIYQNKSIPDALKEEINMQKITFVRYLPFPQNIHLASKLKQNKKK